ncbi:MAG: hypothetical protein RLZZ303_35 [Candidatus Hydrogenedentota bacterium]|jgi:prepilin-type N-terminal cleavage/methylation domain-containing protein
MFHSSPRAGFTFLELIVVTTILAILSMAVLPVFSTTFRSVRIGNAKSDLVAVLRHTQEAAVSQSLEHRFYVHPEQNMYWVGYHSGDEGLEKLFTEVSETWGRATVLPEGLQLEKPKLRKDRENGVYYLACHPNGACDIGEIEVVSTDRRDSRIRIETLGTLGQFEVTER